jgi:hypothetical protein
MHLDSDFLVISQFFTHGSIKEGANRQGIAQLAEYQSWR